jgi:osmoprotectant transport system ATP-binding protein
MIRLDNITKRYGETAGVNGVSLIFSKGKTTGLIGPSGSGKSTLLSLIVGLEIPDAGSIEIDGRLLENRSVLHLRRRMGYVIQDGGLFPHLTARENIELMALETGLPASIKKDRFDRLSTLARLPLMVFDRYPVELSGGQRQRVSLMRALMLDPDIILLDEPLGALDPMIRADLQDDLKGIFESLCKTVILVTHDLSEAAFFCDHIILMNEGRVVQQGQFWDLVERPATPFVESFVNAQSLRLTALTENAVSPRSPEA